MMMNRIPQWFYRQSGVIPYRKKGKKIEILLITSRKRKRWIIPKGIVEPAMSSGESAAKEALEEAGVEGKLSPTPVGEYEYPKWDGICKVEVHLMQVTKIHQDWPEKTFRSRKWMSLEKAKEHVGEEKLRVLLEQVPELIQSTE
jgi:8-oxo-dGTP pyrophosphatase MutT (NUDIX family)